MIPFSISAQSSLPLQMTQMARKGRKRDLTKVRKGQQSMTGDCQ
jgi:hypothetical protein